MQSTNLFPTKLLFIASVHCAARIKSAATLVVCPASLVHQWNNEIERRVKPGTLDVVLYHGPNRVSSATRYVVGGMAQW